MALTDAQIRSLKPKTRRVRKSDGAGLFIEIMPSGGKYFRLACRLEGKQRTYFIGEYPATKLADAWLKAAEYKRRVKEGIDPNPIKTAAHIKKNEMALEYWTVC